MKRLTRKASKKELIESKYMFNYVDNSVKPNPLSNPRKVSNVYDKLGQLEDLEEELGCPLEVRDRALKQEVIYYEKDGKLVEVIVMTCGWDRYRNTKICTFNCLYGSNFATRVIRIKASDYKTTWWLKEDKSE